MPSTHRKPPERTTAADFLYWSGDGTGRKFELVDGELRVMSPGSATHGTKHAAVALLVGGLLREKKSKCRVVSELAVAPRIRANVNSRVPGLGVTCAPDAPGQQTLPDPILLIETLSPGNASATWDNVWSYTTVPTVPEIVVVHSTRVLAEILRRDAEGNWPEESEEIGPDDALRLDSTSFSCRLRDIYAQTHLA